MNRLILAFVLLTGLLAPKAAQASHDYTVFYGDLWSDTSVEYYLNSDQTFNTNWSQAIFGADSNWTTQTNANISFPLASGSFDKDDFLNCAFPGTGSQSSVIWKETLSGAHAATLACYLANQGERFRIRIDFQGDSPDTNWYFTSQNDGVNGTVHMEGVVTHEFGHVSGIGEGSNQDHFGVSPQCDVDDLSSFHTMCAGGIADEDEYWRWVSLEFHDIDLIEDAY